MRRQIEVMRVVRIPPMGRLVVIAEGQRLETLQATEDEAVRRRLLAAIGELIGFAGGYDKLVEAGVAPPLAPVPVKAQPEEALNEQQKAFLASLEEDLKATEGPTITLPSELDALDAALQTEPTPPVSPALNLVEQIDEILQKHVAADSELAGRSIHLEQSAGEALRIRVDGQYYERPQEIEEKAVRIVIKKALEEWDAT